MTAESALAKLQGHPAVEFAEPDYVFALPKQGKVAASRKLQGVSLAEGSMLSDEWGMQKIGMPAVWPVNGGSAGMIVAVIDTGVDLNHPDLRHALVPGTSVLGGSGGPQDDHGHGTHVSGVIVGAVNDGTGIGGIAPNCKLMPVKVLNYEGKGDTGDIVAGLIWAVNNGAKVINMSLGGTGGSRALMAAVKYAQSKDVVLIAAMGNESKNSQEYPAGYPGVIAVGATDEQDQQSDFSNYGSWISISAPGSDILSSLPMGDAYVSRVEGHNRGYDRMDGTSMAAPFVAGVAALIRSAEPRLTAAQVKQRLEKTADDLGDPGFDEQFGWGRLNAARALAGR